jgi:hypothetical protein
VKDGSYTFLLAGVDVEQAMGVVVESNQRIPAVQRFRQIGTPEHYVYWAIRDA